MIGLGSRWDGEERGGSYQKRQHNLTCCRAMRGGNLGQYAAAAGSVAWQAPSMAEWAVAHHRDTVPFAPRQDGVLDRALLQMIEDLIAGGMTTARNPAHLLEVSHVEVADAPTEDLAVPLQLLKTGDGLGKRIITRPVEQIAVPTGSPEACQRGLAGRHRSAARSVVGEHLGHEENVVPTPGDRLADELLCRTRSVELRRIDVSHAEVEPATEGSDRD